MLDFAKEIVRTLCEYEILLGKYKIGSSNEVITIKDLSLISIKGREYLVFKYQNKIIKIHKKYFFKIFALFD